MSRRAHPVVRAAERVLPAPIIAWWLETYGPGRLTVGRALRARALAQAMMAMIASGCGGSALQAHARAALVTSTALAAAGTVADEARDAALDRVEAEHPEDPEHDEAVRAEAARWRPLGQAFDGARAALLAWVQALELARLAGAGEVALGEAGALGARVLALYARVAALARELGARVPALPEGFDALLAAAAGLPLRATAGGGR